MTQIQEVILSIFKEVKQICERHDIPYFAIGGTCLGAVRHRGFIPWDDDLDIAIPIERFQEFLDTARKELPEPLYVYNPDEVKHNHFVWAKVCNRNTAFIEKADMGYKDAYKGVFVDIMPISGVPMGAISRWLFIARLKYYSTINQHARFPEFTPTKASKILGIVLRMFKMPAFNKYSRKYTSLLATNSFETSKHTGYVWDCALLKRCRFQTDWFKETVSLQFEDTTISCPAEYDKFLSCLFGDYMTPPPVEKQQAHSGIVDLEHSYMDYKDRCVLQQ